MAVAPEGASDTSVHGLTTGEIKEVLLQVAVYAGVLAANRAFRAAQQALDDQ